MNKKTNNCILLFVKYPEPGRVKTRLAETIGADDAAKLYSLFVKDIIATLRNAGQRFIVCFDDSWAKDQYVKWLGDDVPLTPQQGADIGQKMKNAFIIAFKYGTDKAIIIGSDIPDIAPEIFAKAFDALAKHPAAVAPTDDGGYCLIGFTAKGFLPNIFVNIDWSTEKVFNQTIEIFQRHKTNFYGLNKCFDIDTFDDLKELLDRNRNTDFQKTASFKKTMQLLEEVNNV